VIFLSYYPTYSELDAVIAQYQPKQVNVFVDLKNCMGGLHLDEAAKNVLLANENSKGPVTDIYSSWLDFVTFHYQYMFKNVCNMHLFMIADTGKSQYHQDIYKDYKCNRAITSYKTLSIMEQDQIRSIIKNNLEVIMKTSHHLFNMHDVYLFYCESDFCPHYYIQKQYQDEKFLNIIYSSDKDMLQTLVYPNTVQFVRHGRENKMWLNQYNWHERLKLEEHMPVGNYVYMKSLMGDAGDNVPSVPGIGLKSAYSLVKNATLSSLDDLKTHIELQAKKKNTKAFKVLDHWQDVERNYKLVGFDPLIKNLSMRTVEFLNNAMKDERLGLADTAAFLKTMKERLGERC